ncbi:MAG: hypothetical protein D6782_06360, partial [Alphaproteobacteria bacterium]
AVLGERLTDFDSAGAQAYALAGEAGALALLHRRGVPLRADVVQALGRVRHNAMLKLVEQRIVRHQGAERLISVIERPTGPCLADLAAAKGLPDRVIRQDVLPPLLTTLRALHDAGIVHRGVNPRRLYFDGDDLTKVRLGECFSAPAGIDQPVVYEPVERALAQPAGRGEGTPADDYYALGVTLLALITGNDLSHGRTPEQMAAAKLAHGSFWALSGGADQVGGLGVLLRGLLNDDARERWGGEQLADWMTGAARTVNAPDQPWALPRGVNFAGTSYGDRRALAQAMAQDPAEAAVYIRRQDLAQWINHHLPQAPSTAEFCRLILTGQGSRRGEIPSTGADHLVARFCTLLDPTGPLRFRSLSVMPDGLGPALAMAQKDDAARADMTELVTSPLLAALGDIMALMPGGGRR